MKGEKVPVSSVMSSTATVENRAAEEAEERDRERKREVNVRRLRSGK